LELETEGFGYSGVGNVVMAGNLLARFFGKGRGGRDVRGTNAAACYDEIVAGAEASDGVDDFAFGVGDYFDFHEVLGEELVFMFCFEGIGGSEMCKRNYVEGRIHYAQTKDPTV
jgi:hypothetical protein